MKKDILIVADYSHSEPITLVELCEICQISPDDIHELIAIGIVYPQNDLFDMAQLRRIKRAQRLQHDLEVNLAGVALVLELLDDLETLQTRLDFFEKHLSDK